MIKIVKNILKNTYIMSLTFYAGFLLISSVDFILTLFINLVGFSFAISQLNKQKQGSLINYLIKMSLGNLIILHVLVSSYAELLPYEIGLHLILYLIVYYYYRGYSLSCKNYSSVYDFKKTSYLKKKT